MTNPFPSDRIFWIHHVSINIETEHRVRVKYIVGKI